MISAERRRSLLVTTRAIRRFSVIPLLVFLALLIGLGGRQILAQDATPTAPSEPPPSVREVLVAGLPEAAPGQELSLVRTTIQPGVTLPMHIHPGMQIAWIESGELHYFIVEGGEVPITRAWMEGSPEPAEMLGPGEETILYPGDAVVEVEDVVHYGENRGDVPVVLWSATLLAAGAPIAEVVEVEATPAE
jgi:mannose-6-phosphate isomerase-like protein (cupin superfamily)